MRTRYLAAAMAAGLLLSACGGAASKPAKPAAGAPTPAPQAGPAGSAGAKSFSVAYNSSVNEVDNLASLVTWAQMRKQGWHIKATGLAKGGLVATEVAKGAFDVGSDPMSTVISADQKGAHLQVFYGFKADEWSIVAVRSIKNVQQLNGKVLGIHTLGSFTDALATFVVHHYQINPHQIVVPGSPARARAMIAGRLPAAFLELPDEVHLTTAYASRFHTIFVDARDNPGLIATFMQSSDGWLKSHPATAEAIVQNLMATARHAAKDPSWLLAQAPQYFPHTNKTELDTMVNQLIQFKVWRVDGGMSTQSLTKTLDFYKQYGGLKGKVLGISAYADRTPVLSALKKIGKQ